MKAQIKLHERGFTILELLITVAIIMILAALLLPKLMAGKRAASDSSAVANLNAYEKAQAIYMTQYGGFAATMAQLTMTDTPPDCAGSGLLDPSTWNASPITQSGFNIVVSVPGADLATDTPQTIGGCQIYHAWSAVATPLSLNTGDKTYYLDDSGTTRYVNGVGAPGPTSTALGQ